MDDGGAIVSWDSGILGPVGWRGRRSAALVRPSSMGRHGWTV